MPAVFDHPDLAGDIRELIEKYPSIENDVRYVRTLIQDDARNIAFRCSEFYPEWVFRVPIHISSFPPKAQEDRCSLIFERDGNTCELLLLYDNDTTEWDNALRERIASRR